MDLGTVRGELYGVEPASFTALRDERAREARVAGDRELASQISKLRRPTTSAWLANLLVRRGGQLDELLELRGALADAQARFDGEQLRSLSSRRHELIGDLLRQARSLADEAGQSMSPSVERELVDTLEAASADATSENTLRDGALTRPLTYSGLGGADQGSSDPAAVFSSASPSGRATKRPGRGQAERKSGRSPAPSAKAAGKARDRKGDRRLREARKAVDRSTEHLAQKEAEEAEARSHVKELREELDRALSSRARLGNEVREARRALRQAATAHERLERSRR